MAGVDPLVHERKARSRSAVLGALACTALAGCGPGTGLTVTVEPTSVVLGLVGQVAVEVTVSRSGGAAGAVALSAAGAPSWVSASFDPSTLPADEATSMLTLEVDSGDPGVQPTTFTLTVTAIGAGTVATAELEVEVEALNVEGVVMDPYGTPLAGHTVYVPGHPPQLTGADGAFSFGAVAAPYDLTILSDTGGATIAHTFVGLTTPTPTPHPIASVLNIGLTEHSAKVSGALQHGTLVPLPIGYMATVCLEGLAVSLPTGCTTVSAGQSTYLLNAAWDGTGSIQVRVRAVVYHVDAVGEPDAVVAAGTTSAFLLTAGDDTTVDVTVSDTSDQASVEFTATAVPGYTLTTASLIAHYSEFASFSLWGASTPATPGTAVAPSFGGASYSLVAAANSDMAMSGSLTAAWEVGVEDGDAVVLDLPTPAVQVTPPNAASGVSLATEFTVTNPEGGVVNFVITPTASGPAFVVTVAGTSARVPDLAGIGLALPSGAEYTWRVLASHGVTDMDSAVTGPGQLGDFRKLAGAQGGGGPGPTASGRVSVSQDRAFTTAP